MCHHDVEGGSCPAEREASALHSGGPSGRRKPKTLYTRRGLAGFALWREQCSFGAPTTTEGFSTRARAPPAYARARARPLRARRL